MNKYFYLYKITNNINNHFYYGVHSTNDLEDGYMGSGKCLWKAYNKYGIENFSKEIIEYFSNPEEMYKRESEIVTDELVNDNNCYNLCKGGYGAAFLNTIPILGENGKCILLNKDSEQYKLGKYKSYWSDKVFCKNDEGKYFWIPQEKFKSDKSIHGVRYNIVTVIDNKSGKKTNILCNEFNPDLHTNLNLNKIVVKDKDNSYKSISREEWENGNYEFMFKNTSIVTDKNGHHFRKNINDPDYHEYDSIFKYKVLVKDKEGHKFWTTKTDPRWLSDELVGITKGYKMPEHVKDKLHTGNNTKGKIGIFNPISNENKFINKIDLEKFINDGWKIGMIQHNKDVKLVNNGSIQKYVEKSKLDSFLNENKDFNIGSIKRPKTQKMIYVNKDGKDKLIEFSLLNNYLNTGWTKGRNRKDQRSFIHIHNITTNEGKFIDKNEAENFLNNGWILGMKPRKK